MPMTTHPIFEMEASSDIQFQARCQKQPLSIRFGAVQNLCNAYNNIQAEHIAGGFSFYQLHTKASNCLSSAELYWAFIMSGTMSSKSRSSFMPPTVFPMVASTCRITPSPGFAQDILVQQICLRRSPENCKPQARLSAASLKA